MATQTTLQVRRDDLRQTRFVDAPLAPPAEGELVVRIDRFALTANNLTYALYGEAFGYWAFFPASEDGWGVIPCWGVAVVTASGRADVPLGERLFGYWPMASHARLTPSHVDAGVVVEGAAHRQALHPFYQRYSRLGVAPDGSHGAAVADADGWLTLVQVMAFTGWMLDDYLAAHDHWGARRVVFTSASSRTATATAELARARGAVEVIGLTSPGHADFVRATHAYDRVVTYEQLESLERVPTVYVDLAGDAGVTRRAHTHLAGVLVKSLLLGGTHWTAAAPPAPDLPGPAPEIFFVPAVALDRMAAWGEAEFARRAAAACAASRARFEARTALTLGEGRDAVAAGFRAILDGTQRPEVGELYRF